MAERDQRDRWRCTVVGCNPKLIGQSAADEHAATGHRIAKWPIRSPQGKAKARERNRSGYYDQYNVGPKSAEVRGIGRGGGGRGVVLTGEDFSLDSAGPFGD
jgi:hypothetical protein